MSKLVKRIRYCFFALFLLLPAGVQSRDKNKVPTYGLTAAAVGREGTYLIKVWIYVSKPSFSITDLQSCAIRGILFDGFQAEPGDRFGTQEPMVTSVETQETYKEFFDDFLSETGKGITYAHVMEGTVELLRIAKKQYKVTAVISVNKDNLRRFLEQKGIIRGLSDGY